MWGLVERGGEEGVAVARGAIDEVGVDEEAEGAAAALCLCVCVYVCVCVGVSE